MFFLESRHQPRDRRQVAPGLRGWETWASRIAAARPAPNAGPRASRCSSPVLGPGKAARAARGANRSGAGAARSPSWTAIAATPWASRPSTKPMASACARCSSGCPARWDCPKPNPDRQRPAVRGAASPPPVSRWQSSQRPYPERLALPPYLEVPRRHCPISYPLLEEGLRSPVRILLSPTADRGPVRAPRTSGRARRGSRRAAARGRRGRGCRAR